MKGTTSLSKIYTNERAKDVYAQVKSEDEMRGAGVNGSG